MLNSRHRKASQTLSRSGFNEMAKSACQHGSHLGGKDSKSLSDIQSGSESGAGTLSLPSWSQRIARWKNSEPWRIPLSSRQILSLIGKGLEIPKHGWNAAHFAVHGKLLILTIARAAKLTQRKAAPYVAQEARKILNGQVERIIAKVMAKVKKDASDPTMAELLFPSNEALWQQAIDAVMAEAGIEVVTNLIPPIQSVMAQGYTRVGMMLGHKPINEEVNGNIARLAREIAAKITRINQTTRDQLELTIRNSIAEGETITETAQAIRDKLPAINFGRSLTIARTELNNSWTQGAIQSFKESPTLSLLSVIGCEAEEPNSPQYDGRSTCNFPDLPIIELDAFNAVGFHVNHTGTLIPSGFRDQ